LVGNLIIGGASVTITDGSNWISAMWLTSSARPTVPVADINDGGRQGHLAPVGQVANRKLKSLSITAATIDYRRGVHYLQPDLQWRGGPGSTWNNRRSGSISVTVPWL